MENNKPTFLVFRRNKVPWAAPYALYFPRSQRWSFLVLPKTPLTRSERPVLRSRLSSNRIRRTKVSWIVPEALYFPWHPCQSLLVLPKTPSINRCWRGFIIPSIVESNLESNPPNQCPMDSSRSFSFCMASMPISFVSPFQNVRPWIIAHPFYHLVPRWTEILYYLFQPYFGTRYFYSNPVARGVWRWREEEEQREKRSVYIHSFCWTYSRWSRLRKYALS